MVLVCAPDFQAWERWHWEAEKSEQLPPALGADGPASAYDFNLISIRTRRKVKLNDLKLMVLLLTTSMATRQGDAAL